MSDVLNVNETFLSVQGEGVHAGVPTFFLRLFGCNLDCSWCDQPTALSTRHRRTSREMSLYEVMDIICAHHEGIPLCVTGGEPFMQHVELLTLLKLITQEDASLGRSESRLITMETNGTIFVPKFVGKVFLSMSPKPSLMSVDKKVEMHGETAIRSWISSGNPLQLKFVVESLEKFPGLLNWLNSIPIESRKDISVFFQPEWFNGRDDFKKIISRYVEIREWENILGLGYKSVRFSCQMHKAIGVH